MVPFIETEKLLAGESSFRRCKMKSTIMNTLSMPISHSHDGVE